MKWYHVFIKSIREQVRDYWILLIVVLLAPFFIFVYYMMIESENPDYDILLVNNDLGINIGIGSSLSLGDSLFAFLEDQAGEYEEVSLNFYHEDNREEAINKLKDEKADVLLVIPPGFTHTVLSDPPGVSEPAILELAGNITDMHYIIGAVWTEELFNRFLILSTGMELPVKWVETQLGHSGDRTEFELYVPGMLILAIIMMMFSASAAIVREPEIQTLKRLKLSRLSAFEFLTGVSLVQIIVAGISLVLALLTAIGLGYKVIPGTLGYLLLVSFLTSLSVIAFSLIFAAFCRSIKDVAIIGTFPLLIFMFFTGASMPLSGGTLFSIGSFDFNINGILAPSHAVSALNKVLVMGHEPVRTLPDILALVILTVMYFILGVWIFNKRHMKIV
jgi:ABC-2 type transport system permease protein